ncbi:hypothetical protein AALP_AA6G138000 [Arabis alpina]|uniref:Transmembrane protein n=1 Tax=Arabis alpina TaxID=50452 RepID=A0A087GP30_ARAAL|nr:hypothetical protein AALP_AA6G138000 [Arabis alpina]
MGKKTSSKLGQALVVVLLLCTHIYRTESATSSHPEPPSITGRRMMMVYHPNTGPGGIGTPPSHIKPGQKGRRLMTYYKPNGDIFTGPSNSGHGGSHIDQASFP